MCIPWELNIYLILNICLYFWRVNWVCSNMSSCRCHVDIRLYQNVLLYVTCICAIHNIIYIILYSTAAAAAFHLQRHANFRTYWQIENIVNIHLGDILWLKFALAIILKLKNMVSSIGVFVITLEEVYIQICSFIYGKNIIL